MLASSHFVGWRIVLTSTNRHPAWQENVERHALIAPTELTDLTAVSIWDSSYSTDSLFGVRHEYMSFRGKYCVITYTTLELPALSKPGSEAGHMHPNVLPHSTEAMTDIQS